MSYKFDKRGNPMATNEMVRARVDADIKNEAAKVLAGMGLTVSDACRMTLTRIAREKRLPFVEEPNAQTLETLERIERGEGLHRAKDADDLFRRLGI
jgi:DNA-damage-inducible protein J